MQIDYEVLRRRPEAGQMDLLLVAAKRDEIKDYAQLARDAKLKPQVVDIDAFTVQNMFEYSRGLPADQTIALINVGASLSSLNIVSAACRRFTRDIANGGNLITEEIRKRLGVTFEQAEAYKCGGAEARPHLPASARRSCEGVSDSIAAEIQRSLDFFMATSGESGDRPHLRDRRHRQDPCCSLQAIERRRASPSRCSRRSRRWRSTPESVNAALAASARRSSPSRWGSRCAKTRRSAHDSRQPPAAEAARRNAVVEVSQTWLLAVLGVVVLGDRRPLSVSSGEAR